GCKGSNGSTSNSELVLSAGKNLRNDVGNACVLKHGTHCGSCNDTATRRWDDCNDRRCVLNRDIVCDGTLRSALYGNEVLLCITYGLIDSKRGVCTLSDTYTHATLLVSNNHCYGEGE